MQQVKTLDDYPLILKAEHIAEIMGCSKPTAYQVMELRDFPLVRTGKLKRVGREAFFHWFNNQASKKEE
jgi:predicted DNA-binding transcriptional regulator AlpA